MVFRHLETTSMSICDDFIYNSRILFLVPFLATKEALAPLPNDPIMWGRLIWLFGHLECQNPSVISDFTDRGRSGKIFSSNFGHQGFGCGTCK